MCDALSMEDRVAAQDMRLGYDDPDLANAFVGSTKPKKPGAKVSQTGPDRLTFVVPHDTTRLNLGAANGPRGLDKGITGVTTDNVHFEVEKSTPTVVTLGRSAIYGKMARDQVAKGASGYGMATAGTAYQHSDWQHCIIADKGDLVVRAQATGAAVLQADAGDAEVNAKNNVSAAALNNVVMAAGCFWSRNKPKPFGDWELSAFGKVVGGIQQGIGVAASLASTGVSLYNLFKFPIKAGGEMKAGVAGPVDARLSKYTVAMAGLAGLVGGLANFGKSVKGAAAGGVGISSGGSVAVSGYASAGMAGGLGASALGGAASIAGAAVAGMYGGKQAGMTGIIGATVSGTFGEAHCYGKTIVNLSGKELAIEGLQSAQLSSNDGAAALHGTESVFVLSKSVGLVGNKQGIGVYKIGDRKNLFTPAPDENVGITVTKDRITAMADKDTGLAVSGDGIGLWCGKDKCGLLLSGDDVTFIGDSRVIDIATK